MAVKIRLTRMGKKRQPSYRVVVTDSRKPRDGRYIEQIGRYDPRQEPSLVEIDTERAQFWLARGAQPSSQVTKLLEIVGTLPARPAKPPKAPRPEPEPAIADPDEAAPAEAEESPEPEATEAAPAEAEESPEPEATEAAPEPATPVADEPEAAAPEPEAAETEPEAPAPRPQPEMPAEEQADDAAPADGEEKA